MTARPFLLALAVLAARPAMAHSQEVPEQPPPAATSGEAPPPPPPASATQPGRFPGPLQRIPRVAVELVLGGASAVGLAYGGYQLACALSGGDSIPTNCAIAGFYGAAAGFGLGIPTGVMLGGSLLDGDGAILPTIFGTGLGMVTVLGGLYFIQTYAPNTSLTPLLLIPLAFAVVGYELSSHDSRAAAQAEARGKRLSVRISPSAAFTKQGAAFGVMMILP